MERSGLLQNLASKSGAYWRREFIRGGGGWGNHPFIPWVAKGNVEQSI